MELRRIGIVGGGVRGRSIAQKAASSGIHVVVLEVSEERAQASRVELVELLDREIEKWGMTEGEKKALLQRIEIVTDPARLTDVDLALESIPEDMDSKKQVMRLLGKILPPEAVLITNTSTLDLSEIAAASGRPEKVVGMHFMIPVTQSPIVELVRAIDTSEETFAVARAFAVMLDKEVIEVFDSPGYVTTRAMMPFLNEAMHLVMEGVASAEDVDKALRYGYELKTGPLEYADRVGLDKVMTWMEQLFDELGDMKYRPCPLLRKHVRAGHFGCRTGKGFFIWDEEGRRLGSPEARR